MFDRCQAASGFKVHGAPVLIYTAGRRIPIDTCERCWEAHCDGRIDLRTVKVRK